MTYIVGKSHLVNCWHGVATTDQGVGAVFGGLGNLFGHGLGTVGKVLKLKNPHRTIPQDGF